MSRPPFVRDIARYVEPRDWPTTWPTALAALACLLGLPILPCEARWERSGSEPSRSAYDGGVLFADVGDHAHDIVHEVAHYVVASRPGRRAENFGLEWPWRHGEEIEDAARHREDRRRSRIETSACHVNLAILERLGVRFEEINRIAYNLNFHERCNSDRAAHGVTRRAIARGEAILARRLSLATLEG
jgi:hypothetical protein